MTLKLDLFLPLFSQRQLFFRVVERLLAECVSEFGARSPRCNLMESAEPNALTFRAGIRTPYGLFWVSFCYRASDLEAYQVVDQFRYWLRGHRRLYVKKSGPAWAVLYGPNILGIWTTWEEAYRFALGQAHAS
jgi:hypothetical protein